MAEGTSSRMKHTTPVCENRCLSLHPQRRSTWLFSGSLKECFTCNLSIVCGPKYIHSVRLAASHRIKVMLQNPKSIEVLSKNSASSLEFIVSNALEAIKLLSENSSEIALCFVQDIVAAAFVFDAKSNGNGHFRFCESFMGAAVSAVCHGNIMDTFTTVTMILLSSIVSAAVDDDEIDTGEFYLSFKSAISGNEKTLLFVVADLLISGSSWHDFDVKNASVAIICALLSVYVPTEGDFIGEFASKLAHGFQAAEGYQQQGNLLELATVLLGTSADECPGSDVKISTQMPCAKKEHIFKNLNAGNALTDVLKICLLCNVQRAKESAIKVIEFSCEGSPPLAKTLVDGGIAEYLFEGMRSHGPDCAECYTCSNLQLFLKALDMMTASFPQSLASKWEFGFEIVLTAVSNCTNPCTEELGIVVLYEAIDCMETTCVSSAPFAKRVLEFSARIGGQISRSSMDTVTISESEPECEPKLRKATLFLIEYATVASFNLECIALLLKVVELYVGLIPDIALINKLVKVLLRQLSHLEESTETARKCDISIQNGVMNLVFCTLAEKAMKLAALAGNSDHDQETLASETVDVLDIIQMALNSSVLFFEKDELKETVLSWCWHNICPVSVLILGEHITVQHGDASKSYQPLVIKDYLRQLAQSEKYHIPKAHVSEIPTSTTEFAAALELDDTSVSSSIAFFFLGMCMEYRLIQNESFVASILQSLSRKIVETNRETSKMDARQFDSICLFFSLSSSFPNLKVDFVMPSEVWPRVVDSQFFCPDSEPELFLLAIQNAENPAVRLMAWKKYAVRNKDESNGGIDLDKRLKTLSQSSDEVANGLLELIVSFELSEELLTIILPLLRHYPRESYSAVPALRQFSAITALREAFRVNSVVIHSAARSPGLGRRPHQLTGLLTVVSDSMHDWSSQELQQLTLMVCDCIRSSKITPKETNVDLLLGTTRFLIRVFEDSFEKSLGQARAYVSKSPSVIVKFAKILALQSSHSMSENETQSKLLAASSACLMTLIFDHFTDKNDQASTSKLFGELPQKTIEWASLVNITSGEDHGCHAYTCRATNCCVLLSTVLEIASETFQESVASCLILRSALVSSCVSQNIILSNAALNCMVHIVSKADVKKARFMELASEKLFAEFLISKLHRKNSHLLRAEAAFLGICIECNLIDTSNERITKSVDNLCPSEYVEKDRYLLRKSDIAKLKRAVKKQRHDCNVQSENSDLLKKPKSDELTPPTSASGDHSRRRRLLIFGAQAVVLG